MMRAMLAAGLAALTLGALPAVASADDPEFPRNGVIPPGTYQITPHPANIFGSPWANCDLQVSPDGVGVVMACGAATRGGQQSPVGPDRTDVRLDGLPFGLALSDIDPRQGLWIGTVKVTGTTIEVPYNFAGISLTRR
ncbi:hypothetical protein ACWEKT_14640 [Nocardia takedensis]|uniref:hypothetical protein n=1 Tax=Nocardia takedensis TaxID=259390 RepID=UPI0003006BB5|nr:hypothetical protein [Nocardia takedensis]